MSDNVVSRDEHGIERLPGGKFAPGKSANPSGRPALTEDERILRRTKSKEFYEKAFFWLAQADKDIAQCKGSPWPPTGMDRIICTCITKSMNGDLDAVDSLLNRLFGKPVSVIELSGKDGGVIGVEHSNAFHEKTDEEMVVLAFEAFQHKMKELKGG